MTRITRIFTDLFFIRENLRYPRHLRSKFFVIFIRIYLVISK